MRQRARPPRQQLGDIRPAVSQHSLGLTDDAVFFRCPAAFLHRRVQVVVPSLADLLPVTTVHVFGDERPTLGAKLLHQVNNLQRKCSGEKWCQLHHIRVQPLMFLTLEEPSGTTDQMAEDRNVRWELLWENVFGSVIQRTTWIYETEYDAPSGTSRPPRGHLFFYSDMIILKRKRSSLPFCLHLVVYYSVWVERHLLVLLCSPGTFDQLLVDDLLPSLLGLTQTSLDENCSRTTAATLTPKPPVITTLPWIWPI